MSLLHSLFIGVMRPSITSLILLFFSAENFSAGFMTDLDGNPDPGATAQELSRMIQVWERKEERIRENLRTAGISEEDIFGPEQEEEDETRYRFLVLAGTFIFNFALR